MSRSFCQVLTWSMLLCLSAIALGCSPARQTIEQPDHRELPAALVGEQAFDRYLALHGVPVPQTEHFERPLPIGDARWARQVASTLEVAARLEQLSASNEYLRYSGGVVLNYLTLKLRVPSVSVAECRVFLMVFAPNGQVYAQVALDMDELSTYALGDDQSIAQRMVDHEFSALRAVPRPMYFILAAFVVPEGPRSASRRAGRDTSEEDQQRPVWAALYAYDDGTVRRVSLPSR